jgi:tetratricopeptide (TPR) repeat protein
LLVSREEVGMGSWDVGSFSNDGASDWLLQLVESRGADKIFRALMLAANNKDYLEVIECEQAVAAAELVAAAIGQPSAKLPADVSNWLQGKDLRMGSELVDLALRVVERVAKNSELKELWDDTDSAADWYVVIEDLADRLRRSEVYTNEFTGKMAKAAETIAATNELCNEALRLISSGQMEEAVTKYDEALKVDPSAQLAYLGRGTCMLSLGRYEKAVENFERAMRIGKDVPEAYHLRAQAYFHLERYHDCIEDLSTLIRKRPDGWDGYWIRGIAYETIGLYNKAVQDFSRVIEKQPRHEEAYGRRAACYEYLGSYDMANRDREKVKKLTSPSS